MTESIENLDVLPNLNMSLPAQAQNDLENLQEWKEEMRIAKIKTAHKRLERMFWELAELIGIEEALNSTEELVDNIRNKDFPFK